MKKNTYLLALAASVALFVGNSTWLLAPYVNHILARGPNLVSEYEALGMPYGSWFRFFDICAALLICWLAYRRRQHLSRTYYAAVPYLIGTIGALQIIDALTPVTCVITSKVCTPVRDALSIIHGVESFIFAVCVVAIAIIIAVKHRGYRWLPVSLIGCSLVGLVARNHADGYLFALQTISLLITTYIIWFVSLKDILNSRQVSLKDSTRTPQIIVIIVVLNALVGVFDSVLHVSRHINIYGSRLTEDTALLSQHTILVSLVTLYLARALWQGSINAWRLVTLLTFEEVIRHVAFGHSYQRTLLYLLIFVLLLSVEKTFTLAHTARDFASRLKNVVIIVAMTVLVTSLLSVTFRYGLKKQWDTSSLSASEVVTRSLLIETKTDTDDPVQARIFTQLLTTVGGLMYVWLFLGLFSPRQMAEKNNEQDQATFRELLEQYSLSSEDYFKMWPADKSYWFNQAQTSSVAYKQSGRYLVALANPLTQKPQIKRSVTEFKNYARSGGRKSAWLLVDEPDVSRYELPGMVRVQIGAHAVVTVQDFTATTIRNKWWRWKRNKALKSGFSYRTLQAPQSYETLDRLRVISDSWLEVGGHKEHTFALGYFDETQLQNQTIHALFNDQGRMVAFANQLPTYGEVTTATIDLMRYMPDTNDVMAFLLSEAIVSLQNTPYTHFDLGFVPLAHMSDGSITGNTLRTAKKLLKPVFSSKGLEQFKNSFDPVWIKNYVVFDGDYIDTVGLIRAIVKVTNLDTK